MRRWYLLSLVLMFIATPVLAASGEHHGDPAWWLMLVFLIQCLFIAYLGQKRYLVAKNGQLQPAFSELQELSTFLLSGTVVAQIWVHGDPEGYAATMHALISTWDLWFGHIEISSHFIVDEIFMAFFFGIAAKELCEAFLKKGGALRGKNGLLPMIGCLGGVFGPAFVFRWLASPEQAGAWAVPCATDIAFSWLGARAIWGARHPAVTFLLALAIADDFIGMGIIAIFYPQREFDPLGLVVLASGVGIAYGFLCASRRMPFFGRWQLYLLPGVLCWFGLLEAGLHAALALVFVVPFMPMHGRDEGLFQDEHGHDTLNAFEHAVKPFVDVGLFFFGLCNAGVAWFGPAASTWDRDSSAVFLGLGVGKTVGITGFTVAGYLLLKMMGIGQRLPYNRETGEHLRWKDVPVVGMLGAMGFTVALFVADAAGGHPSLKLGALASFAYLGLAVAVGKAIHTKRDDEIDPTLIEPIEPEDDEDESDLAHVSNRSDRIMQS